MPSAAPINHTTFKRKLVYLKIRTMLDPRKLRAAILIISETASKDASTDKCISALRDVFATDGGDRWETADTKIVPDNVLDIQRSITQWTDSSDPVNLVVSSGGTGFAEKDVTPEVYHFSSCFDTRHPFNPSTARRLSRHRETLQPGPWLSSTQTSTAGCRISLYIDSSSRW